MKLYELLDAMTFEEKCSLLTGAGSMLTAGVERVGVPQRFLSDGPHGVRIKGQHDAVHFPNFCCAGASFDVDMLRRYGNAIADECIHNEVAMILAPGINIKRSMLCGRNFEYFSEDPLISGKLGAAYINGVQEKGVAVSLKHYAVNSQEIDRLDLNAEIDERTLREIYLRGFEIAVKESAPESVMCAYNKVNAVWCSENRHLLTEILREEWGYEGFVVSDWGAVHNVPRAIAAGLDLIMPPQEGVTEKIRAAIDAGRLTMADVDRAAARLLTFIMKDRPEKDPAYSRIAQHEVAREIAASGIVLLKNENDVLPLTADKYSRIAVVGGYGDDPLICGQGAAEVYTDRAWVDSPLAQLKRRLPECEFKYWKGYDKLSYSPTMLWPTRHEYMPFIADCDAVVIFIGSMESEDTESFDRLSARLNPNFAIYIDNALKIGKRVIVVMQTGSAVVLPPWYKKVDAVVEMWLGGEAAGSAIADVLTGKVNPSGKLPETFPTSERSDLPYDAESRILPYNEKLAVGYRYYDSHPEEIVFPFGHGLSYTTFAYSNEQVAQEGDTYTFSFDLTNTGSVDGAEAVQLYAADPIATVTKPKKALIAFKKVFLSAGETKRVSLEFTARDLAYYNVSLREWVTEEGVYTLLLGASSRDIRLEASILYNADMPYTMTPTGETMLG